MKKLKPALFAGLFLAGALSLGFTRFRNASENSNESPAVEQVIEEPYVLTEEGKDWLSGHNQTKEFLEKNPKMVFTLQERRSFDEKKEERSLEGKLFSEFNEEDLKGLAQTHGFYHERIPELIRYIIKNPPSEKGVYSSVRDSLNDKSYLDLMKQTYNTEEVDCKKISSTAMAHMVYRLTRDSSGQGEVTLCTGIYFGKIAPKGEGHQWVRIGEEIVDPALRPEGRLESSSAGEIYIPIIETTMKTEGGTAEGFTEIVTVPRSYLEKAK